MRRPCKQPTQSVWADIHEPEAVVHDHQLALRTAPAPIAPWHLRAGPTGFFAPAVVPAPGRVTPV